MMLDSKQSFWTRQKVALALVVLMALWFASGILLPGDQGPAEAAVDAQLPFKVRAKDSKAQPAYRFVEVYGVTEANRIVELKSDVGGQVEAIIAKEGAQVKQGDTIIKLELQDRGSRLNEARAKVRQRKIEYDASRKLNEKGLSADVTVAERKAALDQARAEFELADLAFKRSAVIAPFDAVVETIDVEVGELVKAKDLPVVTLVEISPMLVEAQITEFDVQAVKEGMPAEVVLVDGSRHMGRVRFVGVVADPNTRTIRTEIELPNEDGRVPSGVTASVRIPVEEVLAHRLPKSVLALGKEAEIGVKSVDAAGIVTFYPAKIIRDEQTGMLLAGLPEELRVITLGGAFVNEGDTVDVLVDEPPSEEQ